MFLKIPSVGTLLLLLFQILSILGDTCNIDGKVGTLSEGRCFYSFSNIGTHTWHEGREYCKNNFHRASDLAVVSSPAAHSVVSSMRTFQIWIGLYNIRPLETGWIWINGSKLSWENWKSTEPTNSNGYENCVDQWTDENWWDVWCGYDSGPYRLICELDMIDETSSCSSNPYRNYLFDQVSNLKVESISGNCLPGCECPSTNSPSCSNSSMLDCHGHGDCTNTWGNCECSTGYYGEECEFMYCYNGTYIYDEDPKVCSGHGNCTSHRPEQCECDGDHFGDYCEDWGCLGISMRDHEEVCSGHGQCVDVNNCSCSSEDYYGDFCELWSCHGELTTELGKVCGGHGYCVEKDICLCISGYYSLFPNGDCTEWDCGEYDKDDPKACHQRGKCISSHKCSCSDDYEGDLCETWSCGYDQGTPGACSGHGKCEKPNTCSCESSRWGGKLCDDDRVETALLSTFLPLGSLVVLLVLCCIFCCCCLLVGCAALLIVGLVCVGVLQAFRVKKYGELKNFEILLREQEIEDDMTVAHLRIKKSLFVIPFDEIKVDRMIGEGGSSSIVFRATWQNRTVAFKCFKTRLVCQSQERFDEFEREVEVLASVSHPNVIRFFGATLQTPRVGIIMEFCEHGDIVKFLTTYFEMEKQMYPINKKLVMLNEVILALDYLHHRNIIHRDLKLENVLIDKENHCKLMDFGLSTIVERMSQQKTTRIGTNLYMAPEVLNESKYTSKCDIFSFSVFVFILMTEMYEPYGRDTENVHIEVRVSNDPNFRPPLSVFDSLIPSSLNWLKETMTICWSHEASERPETLELASLFEKKLKEGEEEEGLEYLVVEESFADEEELENAVMDLEDRLYGLSQTLLEMDEM